MCSPTGPVSARSMTTTRLDVSPLPQKPCPRPLRKDRPPGRTDRQRAQLAVHGPGRGATNAAACPDRLLEAVAQDMAADQKRPSFLQVPSFQRFLLHDSDPELLCRFQEPWGRWERLLVILTASRLPLPAPSAAPWSPVSTKQVEESFQGTNSISTA